MKARLLVNVYYKGGMVSQELPEVEFNDFSDLEHGIQEWDKKVEGTITDLNNPGTILYGIYEKYIERMGLPEDCCFLVIRVMQVILLDEARILDQVAGKER